MDQHQYKDRLKNLKAKVASEGIILTEAQVAPWGARNTMTLFFCEIEAGHPGYLGFQDTFYVDTYFQGRFCQAAHHQNTDRHSWP